jgi:hypothetical protein
MIFTEKQAGRKIKKCLLIDGQEATQMFSQRNNPYVICFQKFPKCKKYFVNNKFLLKIFFNFMALIF